MSNVFLSWLVGNNLPFSHVQQETRVPENQKWLFVWCVPGPFNKINSGRRAFINSLSVDCNYALIERFWKLQDYGVSALKPQGGPMSVEDIRAQGIIKETTRLTPDGHYEVGLLWRDDNPALRFLCWTKSYDEPPDVYTMQVHIFGAASSTCIAYSTCSGSEMKTQKTSV